MDLARTFALFVLTALSEIVGCYLPYLWLRQGRSAWLLVPAAFSLAAFAWLWLVDAVRPTLADWIGVAVSLLGMLIIVFGPRPA
ncbi:YnfA family protein [Nevskia sp.]|uniref:YnfA family protein n=1 Tax=Nevskia sp. TaxID=1929292 RepID=UPI003F726669